MIPAAIAGLLAIVVVGVVLSRQSSRRKKEAIASLEAERQAMHHYSILELVDEEVADLGLREIPGSESLSADVLLKVWRDAPHEAGGRDRSRFRYVVDPGVAPDRAGVGDVTLEWAVPDDVSPQESENPGPFVHGNGDTDG